MGYLCHSTEWSLFHQKNDEASAEKVTLGTTRFFAFLYHFQTYHVIQSRFKFFVLVFFVFVCVSTNAFQWITVLLQHPRLTKIHVPYKTHPNYIVRRKNPDLCTQTLSCNEYRFFSEMLWRAFSVESRTNNAPELETYCLVMREARGGSSSFFSRLTQALLMLGYATGAENQHFRTCTLR